jgi:hypothetical protein
MLCYSLLLATSLLLPCASAQTSYDSDGFDGPTAVVSRGRLTLVGKYLPTYKQDAFLGIAYARPPIEELRFQKPQNLPLSRTSAKDVKEYGMMCMQNSDRKDMSENCLFLNGKIALISKYCFIALLFFHV